MRRAERGMSESVQWAVLTPVLLLCLLGVVQGGVWWHGRTVARNAAAAGADVAATSGVGAAREAALQVASAGDLRDVRVTVSDGGSSYQVTVVARVEVFLDVGQGAVSGDAAAAKEER